MTGAMSMTVKDKSYCYFVQASWRENVILVTFHVKLDIENEKVRVEESKVFMLGNWEE